MRTEPKRVSMPKTKGLRIEATGCTIYIDHRDDGSGTIVDVVPNGARFVDSPVMVGVPVMLDKGKRRQVAEPTAISIRTVIGPEEDINKGCTT